MERMEGEEDITKGRLRMVYIIVRILIGGSNPQLQTTASYYRQLAKLHWNATKKLRYYLRKKSKIGFTGLKRTTVLLYGHGPTQGWYFG